MVFLQPHKLIPPVLQKLIFTVTFVHPASGKHWPGIPELRWKQRAAPPCKAWSSPATEARGADESSKHLQIRRASLPRAITFPSMHQVQTKAIYCLHLLPHAVSQKPLAGPDEPRAFRLSRAEQLEGCPCAHRPSASGTPSSYLSDTQGFCQPSASPISSAHTQLSLSSFG